MGDSPVMNPSLFFRTLLITPQRAFGQILNIQYHNQSPAQSCGTVELIA